MISGKNTIEGEAIPIDDMAARSEIIEIDPAEDKKLYYDKANLSQAAVFGLREDFQLTNGLRYSWVSLIFYFSYLIGTYPLSFLAQKYPPRIICTIICLLWAVVMICAPAIGSYGGLLANRFLLGVTEAGVSPIFMLVVGMWYMHPEQALRSSFWYSFRGGSLISPLINYGLGHISGAGLHPWQYIYLIAGATTFLWGIALWWLFPEAPQHAPGFDKHERRLLLERIKANNAGPQNHDFKVHHVREALSDYQFWGLILLSITTCTGGGVVNTFSSIVFNGTPISFAQPSRRGNGFAVYPGIRWQRQAFLLFLAALYYSMRAGRIVGFYLINCYSSGWVQCIGLGTSNVAGHTKKSVYAAGTFVGYSVGNIVGPLVFDA
ncbi:unnamed protein product [Clonostachys chloroleuca]|uniref:Major facilitator superfamily (MFS) profile domain-containing protein n=1 Tax=Clonostachys chloroleuca TaxID=1926264 RepID=A0AA35VQ27_9HYPO|nr:unnamed protein product [Clonostachys chloroleuca]